MFQCNLLSKNVTAVLACVCAATAAGAGSVDPLNSFPSHGGWGGGPFEPIVPQNDEWVSAIHVRAGAVIDAIQFEYTDADGRVRISNCPGGRGGVPYTLRLSKGEFIVRVEMRTGSLVDHLTITTSTGRVLDVGGHGGKRVVPSPEVPRGKDGNWLGEIVGVHGRSGSKIDRLGWYWRPFCPQR